MTDFIVVHSGIFYHLFHTLRHHDDGGGSAQTAVGVQFDGRRDVDFFSGGCWSRGDASAVFQHGLRRDRQRH